MRYIQVYKLSDNPNPEVKQGYLGEMTMVLGPSIGYRFKAWKGMSSGLHTTTVKHIQYVDDKTVRFKTLNSEYEIVMGEAFNE